MVAIDGGNSTQAVPVEITLSDENDNAPVFLGRAYLGQVAEQNLTFTSPVTVQV